jgi:hypothetical protein
MSALARALLDDLGPDDLEQLAERLAPYLRPTASGVDAGWLDTKAAATYAGCSVHALHRAMAAGEVRYSQKTAGGKAWFRRADLDSWRHC